MASKKVKITAIKGMKDILPEDALLWQKVEDKTREVFSRFNYSEIRVPICEKTDLFSRSIGDSTDIVEKEMFTFQDRNGDSMTLRPEGTASVVRSCIENNLIPLGTVKKLYYIGPMFRYERPQKGRQRQFHQLGAEALGLDDPMIDAELIHLCSTLLSELGLKDYRIEINSLGTPECRKNFTKELLSFLNKNSSSLCKKCLERKDKNPLRFFDCKDEHCKTLVKKAPVIIDHLNKEAKENFESLQNGLKRLDISFNVNPHIVRGLDYYTKTVFEFVSEGLGAQNSILGGGRYNFLFEELGGHNTPASGFALGMERLIILLAEKIKDIKPSLDVYIASLGKKAKEQAFKTAKILRDSKLKAELEFKDKSLKWQLGQADKLGARFVLIIGEDEIAKNTYIVRNMRTKEQVEASPNELASLIKSLLKED